MSSALTKSSSGSAEVAATSVFPTVPVSVVSEKMCFSNLAIMVGQKF